MSTPLVFLDTETTGLDPEEHAIWEVAWAVEDGPINVAQVPHSLNNADPAALRINGYIDRVDDDTERVLTGWATAQVGLHDALNGAHLVGSNPAFDANMLAAWFPERPWHHRMVDISPMAMILFGWDRPQGMAAIVNRLRAEGYEIAQPDHSAIGDVRALRDIYRALRAVAA